MICGNIQCVISILYVVVLFSTMFQAYFNLQLREMRLTRPTLSHSSLADLRITIYIYTCLQVYKYCQIVVAFAGFYRISEVLHLRRNQINTLNTHCEMFIEKAKTDVLWDGNIVHEARADNSTCTEKLLERYSFKSKINALSSEFMFRPVVFFVNQEVSSS